MSEYKVITIVGVGLIGGSLGLAIKRKGFDGKIIGVSSPQTIRSARKLGVIDEGFPYSELVNAAKESDLIYLCTPIHQIANLLTQIAGMRDQLKENCLVTDVGSTKSYLCKLAWEKFEKGPHFIGGHPMTGSEKRGVEAADPFLFENSIYVITPGRNLPAAMGNQFAAFTQNLGVKVILMDPGVHDKVASVISHIPQLLAVALMNWAAKYNKKESNTLRLAAGGFRDMTRIASSPYGIWRDIIDTNQDEIESRIDEFLEELRLLKADLRAGKLEERFDAARSSRHTIPRDIKGFIHPLHEILVVVDDRPGVIASISKTLADANININDIEVMKVREGEGGTLRFGFDSKEAAQKAVVLIGKLHYQARIRE